jgi:hypothetical protein
MAKSQSELSTVKGVGPAIRKKIESAGIKTVAALKKEDEKSLSEKSGISTGRASNILKAAQNVTAAKKKTASKKSSKKTASKKSTKKKTSKKKSTTKKTTSKVDSKKATQAAASAMKDIIARARDHFKRAPAQHVFVLHGGQELKDLFDLAKALEDIQEEVFRHHVNDDRHDFANWVKNVLDEHALADEMREARKHPEAHERIIYRHITRRVW